MELDEEQIREIEEAYYDYDPRPVWTPQHMYDEPWD